MINKRKETEEKPKAVTEMEEKSDAGKAKKRMEEKKENSIKEANKKFIIKYIIFIICIAGITAGAIYYSIMQLNKKEESIEVEETVEKKSDAEDSIYAINSYAETYNNNAITIEYYGSNDIQNANINDIRAEYVQIKGLLDKNVQDNINKKLKETAKKLADGNRKTDSYVAANYSNVLSVLIRNQDDKVEPLNFDLKTGNEIKIDDIFVSSAPINSFIMEGVFKKLAWDKLFKNYDEYQGTLDMSKVDTSEYEDKALKVVNNYKENKEKIRYYFSHDKLYIYDILDNDMLTDKSLEKNIEIEFLGHKDDIAIYKRFLTSKSIYENDGIGIKNLIVFTNCKYDEKFMFNLSYGKENNTFVEEALVVYDGEVIKDQKIFDEIKKYFIDLSNEDKQRVKSQTESDKGVFYQKEIAISKIKEDQEEFYSALINEYQAKCDLSYFENEAFRDYIKMNNGQRADVGLNCFYIEDRNTYPNLQISETKKSELYFDLNGKIIGTTKAEALEKIKKEKAQTQEQAPAPTPAPDNNTITNTTGNSTSNSSNTETVVEPNHNTQDSSSESTSVIL